MAATDGFQGSRSGGDEVLPLRTAQGSVGSSFRTGPSSDHVFERDADRTRYSSGTGTGGDRVGLQAEPRRYQGSNQQLAVVHLMQEHGLHFGVPEHEWEQIAL